MPYLGTLTPDEAEVLGVPKSELVITPVLSAKSKASQASKNLHPERAESAQTQKKRTDLWEAKFQELDARLRASGRTVTEVQDQSDGQEYQVVFPANRESAQNLSESQSSTSMESSSAQQDPMAPAATAYENQGRALAAAANRRQGPSFREPLKYQIWNLMIMENFRAQCDNKPLPWPRAPAGGADIAATLMGPEEGIRETPLLSALELARRETRNPTLTVDEFLALPADE